MRVHVLTNDGIRGQSLIIETLKIEFLNFDANSNVIIFSEHGSVCRRNVHIYD